MVAGARVQVPPLLLLAAHTFEVDLGAWFVEVDNLQGLLRSFHRRRLFLLLGLDVLQCTEHCHQDSGLIIIIISLRQMSLSLLLLLAIWALSCLMAHLSATSVGVGVDLLLLRRSLAAALAIATAAGGGCLPGVPPSNPLLFRQQEFSAILHCCRLLLALVHRPQTACHILNGEGGQVQHRLYGESDLDVLCRHGVEVLGDRLLFIDGDAVALQLADERLQAEGEVLHRFTILELEVGILLF